MGRCCQFTKFYNPFSILPLMPFRASKIFGASATAKSAITKTTAIDLGLKSMFFYRKSLLRQRKFCLFISPSVESLPHSEQFQVLVLLLVLEFFFRHSVLFCLCVCLIFLELLALKKFSYSPCKLGLFLFSNVIIPLRSNSCSIMKSMP